MKKIVEYEVSRFTFEGKGRVDRDGLVIIIDTDEGERFTDFEKAKEEYNYLVDTVVDIMEGKGVRIEKLTRNEDDEDWENDYEVIAENRKI